MPLPDTGGLTQAQRNQIDQVYANAMAKGDVQLANDWVNFANTFWPAHPTLTVKQVGSAFLSVEVGQGLGRAIPKIGELVGAQVPAAAAKGAENVANSPLGKAAHGVGGIVGALTSVPEFLSRLTSVNTWIRVGEFILGAMLILAGALKLSGQSADLKDIAKVATKVVK